MGKESVGMGDLFQEGGAMSINESKGNMYEFVTHTWNAIKGKCPHECSYCYMKRWGEQPELHLDKKELRADLGKGNFIFVGSSCDMFANGVSDEWIQKVLDKCGNADLNDYLFQSKDTFRMYQFQKYFPENSIVCTTIETDYPHPFIMGNTPNPKSRAEYLRNFKRRMITIEPIMTFSHYQLCDIIALAEPEQVNIGADTGNNHLPEPSKDDVLRLIDELSKFTKVVQKKNLARLLK